MKSKTSTKQKPETAWLEWEDAVLRHCRILDTLAALLFHTGRNDGVTLDVVNDTGGMMKAEVARLKKLLAARPGRDVAR